MHRLRVGRMCVLLLIGSAGFQANAMAFDGDTAPTTAAVSIPRLDRRPTIDDFADMRPGSAVEGQMAKIDSFTQFKPSEGSASSQRTEVYLGFDSQQLYAVFVAFDDHPAMIRSNRVPREQTNGDDTVTLTLDTFGDARRGYRFSSNPFGIQTDFFETPEQGRDTTFDTLWESEGRITERGYVVLMAIPFQSLRFPASSSNGLGILLERWIARDGEQAFWPAVSARIEGRLNQQGRLTGIDGIDAGHTMLFIPYVSYKASHFLDRRDPIAPQFVTKRAEANVGVDAKFVVRKSLVLDLALNPDFSQVETDDPQATANERFEVFVPEKRPFFLENADFFRTPLSLVFTRRIVDPQVGLRLSGKIGPYSVGALAMDDQAPGRALADTDPDFGRRSAVGIVRLGRDLANQSKIGALVTYRTSLGRTNTVAGVDARIRFNNNWTGEMQAVQSSTTNADGSTLDGPAYRTFFNGVSRSWFVEAGFRDVGENFQTDLGFVPRTGIRSVSQYSGYYFRTEGKRLVFWNPRSFLGHVWDRNGVVLSNERAVGVDFSFRRQTFLSVWVNAETERVRPHDFDVLEEAVTLPHRHLWVYFSSGAFQKVYFESEMTMLGSAVNFSPGPGRAPSLADRSFDGRFKVRYQPVAPLTIEARYLLSRLRDPETDAGIFVNHIVRARIGWQFSRALSLRVIAQYDRLKPNASLSSLEDRRALNADVLVAYQVNPWTALYVGYNGNAQNLALIESDGTRRLDRTDRGWLNDSGQVFLKFSYLFRP